MIELSGGLIFIIAIFIIVQSILWFFVPFYIRNMSKNIKRITDYLVPVVPVEKPTKPHWTSLGTYENKVK